MNHIDRLKYLANVDLNLLVALKALEEHRNVTRAAEYLGLSQSAVSHSLRRLREVFKDELYVKTPRGMVPTPKAEELVGSVNGLINSISEVFLNKQMFSPSTLHRTLKIQTTDLVEHMLLPTVLNLQAREAPGLQVSFGNVGFSLPKRELEEGQIDVAIAGFFGELPDGFYKQRLFTDKFKCCVRKGNPHVKKHLSLSTYCGLPHILIAPGGSLAGQVDKILKKRKLTRHVAVGTNGFLAAGWAVAKSDAILTAPSKLIEGFEQYLPVQSYDCPVELPEISVVQVWHERQHRDAAHKWFREKLHAAFSP